MIFVRSIQKNANYTCF